MKATVILIIVFICLMGLSGALYYGTAQIKDTATREQQGLAVFQNPAYDTMRENIPTSYLNTGYNKELPLRVCDYYWASSRKSYLPAGQSYDIASLQAITSVVRAGARVINLDVWPDSSEKWDVKAVPVVRAATTLPLAGSPALDFKECLRVIRDAAWIDNATYPLVLFLEIHFAEDSTGSGVGGQTPTDATGEIADDDPYMDRNVFLCIRIAEALYEVFNGKFIDRKYGFNGRNGLYPFGQIPMADMMGRVAVITDQYPLNGVLDELVNGVCSANQQVISLLDYNENHQNYGGIAGNQIETADLIEHNRKNITLVNNPGVPTLANIYDPKVDLYNPPGDDTAQYGCQFTLMNYQLLDANLTAYLKFFADASFVVKPASLRYIPAPPPTVVAQVPQNYFAQRTVSTPGWFTLNY